MNRNLLSFFICMLLITTAYSVVGDLIEQHTDNINDVEKPQNLLNQISNKAFALFLNHP